MNEIQLKAFTNKITKGKNYKEKNQILRYIYSNIVEFNIEGQTLYVSIELLKKEIGLVIKELNYRNLNIENCELFKEYILLKLINKKAINKFKKEKNLNKITKLVIEEIKNRLIIREHNKYNQEKWNKLLQK